MNARLRLSSIILISFFINAASVAQQKSVLPFTADSLASGNYKDVLKSFFQLAFDKITSDRKEIQFTSNPYAVMAKMDTNLLVDTNYIKYTALRNLNFSFAVKLDSSYRFNGFSWGVKYAIINKRDETVSREFVTAAYDANKEFNKLTDAMAAYKSTIDRNDPKGQLYTQQINDLLSGKINFSQVDRDLQKIIKSKAEELALDRFLTLLRKDQQLNLGEIKKKDYESLRELFQKGLLWTVGTSDTTYKDQFVFSNILLNTELVKGFGKARPGANVELNIKAEVNFVDDTLVAGRDLGRSLFNFEPGLNLVIRTKNTLKSFLEFKLSGSYRHNFTALYANEERDNLILNGTLRIRIINDIWVPVEIKYDPKSGNVFGLLNVRVNFTTFGKVVKEIVR